MNNKFFGKKWLLSILLIVTVMHETYANNTLNKQMHNEENLCRVREDCEELNLCLDGKCKHKNFFPITEKELIGAILIFIGSAISNAGGIGGGGLLVPILILYLNFYTKEAIPISKLMIFTGSLTAFIMGLKNKNPYRDATAIDYNIAIILIPLVLFGTMIGVTLNKIFPPWMILVCLTIILIINTVKTIKKGIEYYSKEKSEASNSNLNQIAFELEKSKKSDKKAKMNMNEYSGLSTVDDEMEEKPVLTNGESSKSFRNTVNSQTDSIGLAVEDEFDSITRVALLKLEYKKDKSRFPFNKIIFCLISYSVLLIVTLLKGTGHTKSIIGIETCSPLYWSIYISYLPISLVITYIVGKLVYEEYNYRLEIGYPFHQSDIKWTKEIIIKYPIYALSAGVLSGLLGIGGGLILGPLLLDLGVHPIITTATSNFMVVFISSSTTLQYIMLGMMNFNYGLVCTVLSTFGSFVGTFIIQKYLEKTKKNSVLVFILAGVLGLSTIFIPYHTLTQMTKQIVKGENIWEFHSPC